MRQRLIVYENVKYRKMLKKKAEVCRPATMIKNFSRQLTLQKIVERRTVKNSERRNKNGSRVRQEQQAN